jgi:hypothetical protein
MRLKDFPCSNVCILMYLDPTKQRFIDNSKILKRRIFLFKILYKLLHKFTQWVSINHLHFYLHNYIRL